MASPGGGLPTGPARYAHHHSGAGEVLGVGDGLTLLPMLRSGLEARPSGPCNAPRAQSGIQRAFGEESLHLASLVFTW